MAAFIYHRFQNISTVSIYFGETFLSIYGRFTRTRISINSANVEKSKPGLMQRMYDITVRTHLSTGKTWGKLILYNLG